MINVFLNPFCQPSRPISHWALASITAVCLLTGCGGGGGGNNSNGDTSPPPPTQSSQWDSMNWDSGQWQ